MTIKQVLKHFGGVRLTAQALGLSPKSVYAWGYRGRTRPPEVHQWRIQAMTGGALKVEGKS